MDRHESKRTLSVIFMTSRFMNLRTGISHVDSSPVRYHGAPGCSAGLVKVAKITDSTGGRVLIKSVGELRCGFSRVMPPSLSANGG